MMKHINIQYKLEYTTMSKIELQTTNICISVGWRMNRDFISLIARRLQEEPNDWKCEKEHKGGKQGRTF